MNTTQLVTALLAAALVAGLTLSSVGVVGAASAGEVRVTPGELSLQDGDQQTIKISYDSLSTPNPEGMEFAFEYDPDVINVIDRSPGAYFSGGIGGNFNNSPGEVRFGIAKDDPVGPDAGTVATITIELADGVEQGDTTPISFTSVDTVGVDGTPETIDGSVEAAERTEAAPENPVEYDVEIDDPTLSPDSPVGSAPSEYTLSFDVVNVSANNDPDPDRFTVTMPEKVTVAEITNTTVVERGTDEPVELVGSDPATDPDPGNEINFAVDPIGPSETQALSVTVELRLSADA